MALASVATMPCLAPWAPKRLYAANKHGRYLRLHSTSHAQLRQVATLGRRAFHGASLILQRCRHVGTGSGQRPLSTAICYHCTVSPSNSIHHNVRYRAWTTTSGLVSTIIIWSAFYLFNRYKHAKKILPTLSHIFTSNVLSAVCTRRTESPIRTLSCCTYKR